MNHINSFNIEQLSWEDAKQDIQRTNPDLFDVMQAVKHKHGFIKAYYHFGDRIIDKKGLNLPTTTATVMPLRASDVPASLQKELGYSMVPIGLITNKCVEVFFETAERLMPAKLCYAGSFIGLKTTFDEHTFESAQHVVNMSAGARTIFMLPKIGDTTAHMRLKKKYQSLPYAPKNFIEQCNVFASIAKSHTADNKQWRCEILFLCEGWLKEDDTDIASIKLHHYLIKKAWENSYSSRSQITQNLAWEAFSEDIFCKNWKPKYYIINTVKHLLSIGDGNLPGLAPTQPNEDTTAPTQLLHHAYIYDYAIKQIPIIMQLQKLQKNKPVYYSLAIPTLMEYAPKTQSLRSVIADLRDLKTLMGLILLHLKNHRAKYEFFHIDQDQFAEIENARDICLADKNLTLLLTKNSQLKFPVNSPFFYGCIRISLTE